MTDKGARRLSFCGVALGVFIILACLFSSIRPAGAQQAVVEIGMPQPACDTKEQVEQLVRLKNSGLTWAGAVAATNAGKLSPVCSLETIWYMRGNALSRVVVDNQLLEIGPIETFAIWYKGRWRPLARKFEYSLFLGHGYGI